MPASTSAEHTNRLIHETSPYLLQHAHNPVDWYAWGDEAIEKARRENKPIFLSIGYSACHWCHVMERESFENPEVAEILNRHFISIKVDREERPDLDDIYMQAVQMMTGHGGWPMSVFLKPDLRPFFGGTYFPPNDRPPMMGFRRLLLHLADLYEKEPGRIEEGAAQITEELKQQESALGGGAAGEIGYQVFEGAINDLSRRFDSAYGGFGGAPKFPPSMAISLLLREYHRRHEQRLVEMAEKTLQKMALGGMYDQLGGGFHRYSTDHLWLVPHFEKMLYDNALLAPVYFDASLVTGNKFYEQVGREILDYVDRDMTDPQGGYYSAEDADSEGVEGKFYVWSKREILDALGDDDGELYCEFYGVTDGGNFEGENILNVITPLEEFARRKDIDVDSLRQRLAKAKAALFEIRKRRIHPFKDTKVLTAWNGMMISAMARGAQVTGDPRYRASAERAGRFILSQMRSPEGLLYRTWGNGRAKIPGFIDDYAFFTSALIDLYETTFDPSFLENASQLADTILARFYDSKSGGFFTADGSDPTVLLRRKDTYDGATPSGNSMATFALLRLAAYLDRSDYREAAMKTINAMHAYLTKAPGAVHQLLNALGFALDRPKEIAIIGDPDDKIVIHMIEAVWKRYLPARVLASATGSQASEGFNLRIALLRDKGQLNKKPTAFVCENYTCRQPVQTAEELIKLL